VIDVGINSVDDSSDKRGDNLLSSCFSTHLFLSSICLIFYYCIYCISLDFVFTFFHFNQHTRMTYLLIDLQLHVSPGYKLVGDVDYAGCRQVASQITPVRLTSASYCLLFFSL
jgi:hypothetical protein